MITATADNSFCPIERTEEYFAARLHSGAWTGASEADRNIALVQATSIFNLLLAWKEPVDNPPEALVAATCEMALYLLQEDPLAKDSMEGLSRIKLGELELEKDGKGRRVIPAYIFSMLAGLADLAVSGCSIPVIRS